MKILLADDEVEIRNVLRILLVNKGYEVLEAANGADAVKAANENKDIDLCIMDIMMPVMSGVDATAQIRHFSDMPILFLTAKSLDSDKMRAYSSGGDDYIVKPFSSRELLMKVEALIRRYTTYGIKTEGEIQRLYGGITISADKREITKNGSVVEMRDKELDVLLYLAKNRGRVVSPSELYESVWGEIALPSSGNTVTVHILNLRRKLEENPSSPRLIRTVWGKGYQID